MELFEGCLQVPHLLTLAFSALGLGLVLELGLTFFAIHLYVIVRTFSGFLKRSDTGKNEFRMIRRLFTASPPFNPIFFSVRVRVKVFSNLLCNSKNIFLIPRQHVVIRKKLYYYHWKAVLRDLRFRALILTLTLTLNPNANGNLNPNPNANPNSNSNSNYNSK